MTLILEDVAAQGLLSMAECIKAMEDAFAEYANGIAANRPRVRYTCPTPNQEFDYFANIIVGAVPGYNVAAVRIDSSRMQSRRSGGPDAFVHVPQYRNRACGLVLLYNLETTELMAIIHDFTIEGIRVGATTALAVKYLAREDASILGLFGTGKHARADLEGIALVRPLRQVKVFSPNPEHRLSFAHEMSERLGVEVLAVDEPRKVVHDVDIVCCATSSSRSVFDGSWLESGQLVTSIVNSDVIKQRAEVDETVLVHSNSIFINDKESVYANRQVELLDPIERGLISWEKVHELGDVVVSRVKGRSRPEELVYYKNNTGMGIQFAAAASVLYRKALERGLGQEVPTDWFSTDVSAWQEKGYYPSP